MALIDDVNNLPTTVNGGDSGINQNAQTIHATLKMLAKLLGASTYGANLLTAANAAAFRAAIDAATPAQVTTAVNAVIAAAPGALDTLDELAAALGDDPNFATTITNALAAKYTKPANGIPKSDLSAAVQTILDSANSVNGTPLGALMARSERALYQGVTYTANNTAPTGMIEIPYSTTNATKFRVGSPLTDLGGLWAPLINGSAAAAGTSPAGFTAEVIHNSTRFVWRIGYGSSHQVYVDDQPVTPTPQPNVAGNYTYVSLTFPTAIARRIRMECNIGTMLAGAYTTAVNTFHAPPPRPFRAIVIGDSWAQLGFSEHLAMVTGWSIHNMGQGSTGYVADGGGPAGSLGHSPFGSSQRMAALAALGPADLIIVLGSANDTPFAAATVKTAAQDLWTAIKTARPTTPLIVLGTEPSRGGTASDAINTELKSAAAAHTGVTAFIDWRGLNTITGTGRINAKTGDGLNDFYMDTDDLHLTAEGYLFIAREIMNLLAPIRVVKA